MFRKTLAVGLALSAAAFPAAAVAGHDGVGPADPRSPDARDVDLRSPDARDAALRAEAEQRAQAARNADPRSPDARDAALAAEGAGPTRVVVAATPATGFDWGDAGVGATAALGLVAVGGGAFMVAGVKRRRHPGAV